METVKRLFISLIVLLGCSAGAWAIEQDSDGYYLIGSVQDWKDFANIVQNTNQGANAKMVADVDLGGDQTKIGATGAYDSSPCFSGTFDGQGYTLTVAYTGITENYVGAPFAKINGATIKNLHVAGTINSGGFHPSVVSDSWGTSTIENVWSSLVITSTRGGWVECGGIVGCMKNGNLTVRDCLFTGSITASGGYNGCFVGYKDGGTGTIINCLSLGTFSYPNGYNSWTSGPAGTHNNCFVKQYQGNDIPAAMKVTEEQIADGTIATALGDAWVQDAVTGQPMLKIFTTMRQDEEGYYLIGSVTDWKRFAELVNSGTNTAANAKMIRDVDLGDDQTMIGTSSMKYQGTFDGQAHTLTVNYFGSSKQFIAPLHYVDGGSILNLRIDGIVSSSSEHLSGLIGKAYNEITIENCLVAAEIKMNSDYAGGFVGNGGSQMYNDPSKVVFKNCLFAGTFTGVGGSRNTAAGFYGWGKSTPVFINCLENGTYNNVSGYNPYMYEGTDKDNTETTANSYYKHGNINLEGISDASAMTDGEIVSNLGDAWVIDGILNIPMLKIFANTGEEVPVTDLSATETANTYIVSAAGKYKFKATVKGNGGLDPLTGTIATPIDPASIAGVKVLWELGDTYGRAIKYEDGAYDISYSDGYVYFSTPNSFTTGVACVAIYDSSDNILWSWDIWSTPEPGTVTHNGNIFMDRNLGAIDLNNNRGFLYQWGRKDAFSAATGSYASFTFVPALLTAFNTIRGIQTIDYCIKHPTTHVNNGDENSWMSREEYEKLPWRDDIKTIYDPCPAGWRVPTAAEQNGYSGLPGTGFSNAINEFGNPGSGYYRSSTISSYPRAYAFRQSGQQNNWGTNPAFAIRPVKEGIYFIYTVPASGLGTFSAAENVIIPAGLTAYYCTTLKTYEDGKLGVRVSKLNGIIPANTGVLLEGSPGLSYPLTATTVEAAAPAGNSLVAVVESQHIAATEGDYTNFMMKGGKFIKIQQDDESVKMPANRAYLPLLTTAISGSNAKEIMLYWDDEETTGIERMRNVENERMRNGNIYNLNGQKLSAPQKGINIINGRKVIVK